MWDADTGKLVRQLRLPAEHGDTFRDPRAWLSADGRTIAVPFRTAEEPRGRVLIAPLDDSGTFRLIGGHNGDLDRAAFSPDGKRIATSAGSGLVVWDLDGAEAWGEDQDMWPVHTFAADARRRSVTRVHHTDPS